MSLLVVLILGLRQKSKNLYFRWRNRGNRYIFISSELDEVMRTGHRIIVLRDREMVAEFPGDVSESTIIQAIAGSEV